MIGVESAPKAPDPFLVEDPQMRTIPIVLAPIGRGSLVSSVTSEILDSIAGIARLNRNRAVPVELSALGVRSARFVAVVGSWRNFARPGGMRNPRDVLN
jgi:hypothetical protein